MATGGQRFTCRACKPVLFRHEDGWDIYPRSECYMTHDGTYIPAWFDQPIVTDAPTRAAAIREWAEFHPGLGFCIATHKFA